MSTETLSLAPTELRVLGTLLEKQRTVPETYPLSLNALMAGCNQKTSRNPVTELSEHDLLPALERLKELGLVNEVSGSRVVRFAHQFEKVIGVPSQSAALLTVLMLRGPQTAGELRLNSERLHKFADISSVEAFLAELASRPQGALVRELPRQPGSRENRWMHLLGDAVEESAVSSVLEGKAENDLAVRVSQLEAEVSELRGLLQEMLIWRERLEN